MNGDPADGRRARVEGDRVSARRTGRGRRHGRRRMLIGCRVGAEVEWLPVQVPQDVLWRFQRLIAQFKFKLHF